MIALHQRTSETVLWQCAVLAPQHANGAMPVHCTCNHRTTWLEHTSVCVGGKQQCRPTGCTSHRVRPFYGLLLFGNIADRITEQAVRALAQRKQSCSLSGGPPRAWPWSGCPGLQVMPAYSSEVLCPSTVLFTAVVSVLACQLIPGLWHASVGSLSWAPI